MHRETSTRPRLQRRVLVVLGILLLLAAGYWFFTEGPGQRILSPPGSTVAVFEGPGAQITPSFEVREGWQVQWDSRSDSFEMAIGGDRDFGTVIELDEPTSGITAPVGAGSFYLDVSAEGDWSITVIQGD